MSEIGGGQESSGGSGGAITAPLGQETMATSVSVAIASDQTAVPVNTSSNNLAKETGGNLASILSELVSILSQLQSTLAISAVSLPLPSNAAQETGGNLAAIETALTTGPVPVSVTSLPLPSNAAKETGGNLDSIKSDLDSVKTNTTRLALESGGNLMNARTDLDQIVTSSAGANSTLITLTSYFNSRAGSNLDSIKADVDKIPSQGAALTAASTPVNIASDQIVPVSISSTVTTSTIGTGVGAVDSITSIETQDKVVRRYNENLYIESMKHSFELTMLNERETSQQTGFEFR